MIKQSDTGLKKQLLAVIILLQLFWCQLSGLDPDKGIDQYLVDQWEISDGIPSNMILSISQTPDGYLWIATNKGLVRFDGIKFSIVSFVEKKELYSQQTRSLFVDKEGVLWIGSAVGLTSYHYKTGQFKIFTGSDGITDDGIRCITGDMRGNLWISFTSSYVNRFSKGKFTAFNASHGLTGKKVNAIVEDQKGNLLFASRENGVFIYRNDKFFYYPIPGLANSQIITMNEDRRGDLWIGATNGLFRVTAESVKKYTTREGLSDDYITTIKEDSERNLWIGTLNGLNRVKRKQNNAVDFEGLFNSLKIMCIWEDSEKSLWIGTYESGIKRLRDGKFISYAPLEALREEIFSAMMEDRRGDTWIGTVSGKLFRYHGSRLKESVTPPGIAGTGIAAIAEDNKGNIWLGTNGKGVFQLGTSVRLTTREGLSDNSVTSIFADSRGNLWFSTFDGVSVFRNHDKVIESFKTSDGLSGKTVHSVYEDKRQNIWIAADKGITLLPDVLAGGGQKAPHLANVSPQVILSGISVTCIYEDSSATDGEDRILWIATEGAGLKRFRLKDRTLTSYTTADGMTANFIYQFLEDQQHNFWLMSNTGILRISKPELNRFARGELDKINCISYGVSDGLKSLEFNNRLSGNSVLQASNGELWFITSKGISIVNPAKVRVNKTPPPVLIEALFFNGQPIALHREVPYVFKGITEFSFHFTAPTFLSPGKIKFRYQLEGFDKEWIFLPTGEKRVVYYQNLPNKTYTFRVTACNTEGVWNQSGDSITFTLEPFFYQTLVFKIAVFFLIIFLAAAAVYIYKKRPFAKKKKYQGVTLNPQFAEVCTRRLNHLIEVEKVYLDEDISLQSLAEKISIQPYQLSQLLNEKLNQNFSDFINYHRIEEAKRILLSPRGAGRKNTVVAYDVGFNSMTAFYKAFKKFTGMTPNQLKKQSKKK